MRTDPFRELDRLTQQAFGRNGTWARPAAMPMDAYRDGEEYVVHFDLPVVDPSSIDLDVERNLTVRAERKTAHADNADVQLAERPKGVFSRQLFLGDALDTDNISGDYAGSGMCGARTGELTRVAASVAVVFDGFALHRVDVGEAVLRVRHGGSGSPVLLLHGHPRTHATWHRVAPLLAAEHTVVCPDLRGYGESSKPETTADHEPYSKRAMARDMATLMRGLGHEGFAVVGHDRGGYVAHRLAMDHPQVVTRLAVLDVVPIGEALARCRAQFATSWWHWFFLAQPAPKPERAICVDPDAWYGESYPDWHRAGPERMGTGAWEDFQRAIHDPATVHAMCEDYRAGLGVDRAADDADRAAGRRIECPVLALWAAGDDLPDLYGDVLGIWRGWARDVRGRGLDCGHHLMEDAPEELAAELRAFLRG